jgi:dipeptidyl-peptidase 4
VSDSFPRQYARTRRFTLGEPRDVTVSPDGRRVAFARSRAGDDPLNCLWLLDLDSGEERLVADPADLLADGNDDADLPPEERARRERLRESAGGVTGYATDRQVTVAAFALGGRLYVAGLLSGRARHLPVDGPVFDPRPDPQASRVAYVSGRSLRIAELDGSSWELAGEDPEEISWGMAEFVAAEEMDRQRGYWWSPDGSMIAACRVDVGPVDRWYIGDPATPSSAPHPIRYPAAGRANARVGVHVLALDGGEHEVRWDHDAYPYLAAVRWADDETLLLTVQARDQRSLMTLRADPLEGDAEPFCSDGDAQWVELVPGTPTLTDDGRLVTAADRDGVRRLLVDQAAVTPDGLQVRSVVGVAGATVTFLANPVDDATVQHVWQWHDHHGLTGLTALTDQPGIHAATVGGPTVVIRSATLAEPGARTGVLDGPEIESYAERPIISANVALRQLGPDRLAVAVVLPHDHDGTPLPVLVDPYGGPHALRVVQAHNAHVQSQWFAEQGFAVVVCDGRGTPGRGSAWERAVHRDLTAVLDDQVTALQLAAEEFPLDLARVAIRGWSFGGWLAALAVLTRPDVFHAAVAGAPVTDWGLYDTHYTERYLGDPFADPAPYADASLLAISDRLTRPLLLVHGLADDNVVAAHTLRLSSALLGAGKPHEVLPLVGVTHMTPQEVIAENLLLHQLGFLRRALGIDPPAA